MNVNRIDTDVVFTRALDTVGLYGEDYVKSTTNHLKYFCSKGAQICKHKAAVGYSEAPATVGLLEPLDVQSLTQ